MNYQVLWKAHIKTHWRTLKGGRKVEVKAHERKSRPRLFSELKPTRKRKFNIPGQLELPLMVMDPEEFRKELKKRRIERAEKKRKQWGELLFKEDPNLAREREFLQRKAKLKAAKKKAQSASIFNACKSNEEKKKNDPLPDKEPDIKVDPDAWLNFNLRTSKEPGIRKNFEQLAHSIKERKFEKLVKENAILFKSEKTQDNLSEIASKFDQHRKFEKFQLSPT